jgi:segregation and condensation protein A
MMQEPSSDSHRDTFEIQSGPVGKEIRLNLSVFEGPMDLLLYLIKKEEVDIFDIPISLIADEYLRYLQAMEADSLEVGGEFLVLAATLLSIKARMLLPRQVDEDGEPIDEDPRRDLVERILEYKAFKESAQLFRQLEENQAERFGRASTTPAAVDTGELQVVQALQDVTLFDLLSAFRLAMDRFQAEKPSYSVQLYPVTVDEMMVEIRERLRSGKKVAFSALIARQTSRIAIIILFLAILEMVRIGEIGIKGVVENDFLILRKS